MLDRLNLSRLNYTYFPSFSSVLKLHIRLTVSSASQDLPSASRDINHPTWALSMQGNIAKGDSGHIFHLQRNSPRSFAAAFSVSAPKRRPLAAVGSGKHHVVSCSESVSKPFPGSRTNRMISHQPFVLPVLLLSLSRELVQ